MKNRLIGFVLVLMLTVVGMNVAFNKHGSADALAPTDIGGQGSETTLLAQGVHVGSGTSDWKCDEGQFTSYVQEVAIVGTLTGTNPTLNIVMEHSIDHGTTVAGTVNSFPAVNATTVPAVMTDARINGVVIANTPVAYGRCMRIKWTAVATGTASANFGVVQYRH